MKSGDKLLCSGNGRLSKAIITMQGLSGYTKIERQISHVAGVCYVNGWMADTLNLDFTGLGVFESTTFNKWRGKKGLQVNE